KEILSIAARIFDVNGYISPVIFWIKCLLQRLWLLHSDWDDDIPSDLRRLWSSFIQELPLLSQVTLPRYILSHSPSSLQIVSFADASDKGYGCVVYLRNAAMLGNY
ncbi:hypothetical protein, partial [Klebsiella pneumoniae]|uniref:hypothetical protein n=1 Tax=Klebsiella pneumoniae TaxID=573 RepID=UPI004055754E